MDNLTKLAAAEILIFQVSGRIPAEYPVHHYCVWILSSYDVHKEPTHWSLQSPIHSFPFSACGLRILNSATKLFPSLVWTST